MFAYIGYNPLLSKEENAQIAIEIWGNYANKNYPYLNLITYISILIRMVHLDSLNKKNLLIDILKDADHMDWIEDNKIELAKQQTKELNYSISQLPTYDLQLYYSKLFKIIYSIKPGDVDFYQIKSGDKIITSLKDKIIFLDKRGD